MNTPPIIELPGSLLYPQLLNKINAYKELYGDCVPCVSGRWDYGDFQTEPYRWYIISEISKRKSGPFGMILEIELEQDHTYLLTISDGQDVCYKLAPREVK